MFEIYVKKLVSLNPDEYDYLKIDIAWTSYNVYIENCRKTVPQTFPKTFVEWLETEI